MKQTTGAGVTKKYMTLNEAAEYSHIPARTLRHKIHLKVLPAYKPGKSLLIDPKELDLFIKRGKK